MKDLVVEGVVVPAADLEWTAVRSQGPGGQNVNKVSSKVVLRLDLEGTPALDAGQKARLRRLARNRLDAAGALVVASQRTRSQEQNLDDARAILAALIAACLHPPRPRKPTRPSAGARRRRLEAKKHEGAKKRERKRTED